MARQLQEIELTERERALYNRLGDLYLEGRDLEFLASRSGASMTQTLCCIHAVKGAETMQDNRATALKRQHRQHCRCHEIHHRKHLTTEERDLSAGVSQRYIDGVPIKQLASELRIHKDRVATMVAVGYGLDGTKATEFKAVKAQHKVAYEEIHGSF